MTDIMSSPLYKCAKCNGKFEFENVRYSIDGKQLVCSGCYDQLTKASKAIKETAQKAKQPITDASEHIRLICIDCRYKFSLKKLSKVNVRCPYCGRSNLIKDEVTVNKLLNEVQ